MRDFDKTPARAAHRYAWLWEPLGGDASFILKSMFGAKAMYIDGKCQPLFMAKTEPWRGVLVYTAREQQPSLMEEFPSLSPHPVLSKWLYLPESIEDFESTAQRLESLVGRRDPRVEGSSKKKKIGGRGARN